MPALEDVVLEAVCLRYNTIQDHIAAIFALKPGSSGAAMTLLWGLEDSLNTLHKMLIR